MPRPFTTRRRQTSATNPLTVVATAVAVLLAGGASGPASDRWIFEKVDATEAQMKRNQPECVTHSMDTHTPVAGGMPRIDREAYRACMEERGYQVHTATR